MILGLLLWVALLVPAHCLQSHAVDGVAGASLCGGRPLLFAVYSGGKGAVADVKAEADHLKV